MHQATKAHCCLYLLLLSCFFTYAQQFGGHPPSQKWRQINTDTVRIIFPPGLETQASGVAGVVHGLARNTYPTIGDKLRKVSIVLQNQTTLSNGYVGLGPWRSEFLLTPMQNSFDLGSIPWIRSLSLHEYRHVQQYNNFRKGISKAVYLVFGEQALELVNSAAIPNWFWEGDAVHQETIMSEQGRGRLANFFNGYRSLWAAGKNYSWLKLRNGSLRDYIPDHYHLGYLMIAYGREKYGDSFWRDVTNDAVRYRGLFYPFQRAVKKYSTKAYPAFRKEALDYFKEHTPMDEKNGIAGIARSSRHFLGDEEFPQWIDSNTVLFVKSSYKKVPAFVFRDMNTGKEKELSRKDISADNYYSYRNGRIVYSAFVQDLRWSWKDYSDIRLLNVNDGKQRTITYHSKYFSPDISEDGEKIVAVYVDPSGNNALHILNAENGRIEAKIPNKENLFFTFPKFYANEKILTAVRNSSGEMALVLVTINTGNIEQLTPWSMNVIGYPLINESSISFTASSGERDQLFILKDNKLFRCDPASLNATTGNYQLTIWNNKYCWSAFSAVGYRLMQSQESENKLIPGDKKMLETNLPSFGIKLAETKSRSEGFADTAGKFSISKYPKAFRLFNIHSFRPNIEDRDYRFSLIGQNVLNTLQSEVYFNYNSNERNKELGVNLTYAALFPWIRLGTHYTIDRTARYRNNNVYWNEWEGRFGLLVPLNFTGGKYFRYLNISSDIVFNKRDFKGFYKDSFDSRGFGYMRANLNYSAQVQQARQHIFPRFAQSINLDYTRAVTLVKGNQFLASASWYLPGIAPTHNLVINTAFQGRDTLREVNFSNSFPYSRGYIAVNFHRMYKLGANYHFPLVYPDFGIASIVYFLRVRANVFYDFTRVYDYTQNRTYFSDDYRSAGTEIYFDTKWWNQHSVSFGFRYSRLLDAEKQGISPNQWEFILPVNIFGN